METEGYFEPRSVLLDCRKHDKLELKEDTYPFRNIVIMNVTFQIFRKKIII